MILITYSQNEERKKEKNFFIPSEGSIVRQFNGQVICQRNINRQVSAIFLNYNCTRERFNSISAEHVRTVKRRGCKKTKRLGGGLSLRLFECKRIRIQHTRVRARFLAGRWRRRERLKGRTTKEMRRPEEGTEREREVQRRRVGC